MDSLNRCFLLLLLLAGMTACSDDEEQLPVVPMAERRLPAAEYEPAVAVLMHEPGTEVQGYGGLTKVFDVEAMQQEHRAYVELLRKNGIHVYEAGSLLEGVSLSGLKGFYFTRDQSITTLRGHVLCQMANSQRRQEPELIRQCYRRMGRSVCYEVKGTDSRLEGGDYLPFGTLAFIGEGARTNRAAIEELMEADAFGHDTVVVVKDRLRHSLLMHLDTYFNIIDRDLVTLPASRVAAAGDSPRYVAVDVFARGVGERAYRQVAADVSLVTFLHDRGIRIVELTADDETNYVSNFLCIAPRHIIAIDRMSQKTREVLETLGVTVEQVKLDELTEGAGAAHCMTQVLSRASAVE